MTADLRASFKERDQYLESLSAAYAEGRLDDAEFERRRDQLLASITHAEMQQCFDGLPAPRVSFSSKPNRAPVQIRPAATVVKRSDLDRRGLLAVVAGAGILGLVGAVASGITAGSGNHVEGDESAPADQIEINNLTGGHFAEFEDLRAQNLTWLIDLTVTPTTVSGTAHTPSTPGQHSKFASVGNGLVQISDPVKATVVPSFAMDTIPWDDYFRFIEKGVGVFAGEEPTKLVVKPNAAGEAQLTFTYPSGTITLNADASRIIDVTKSR